LKQETRKRCGLATFRELDLTLIDRVKELPQGEALDLSQMAAMLEEVADIGIVE